MQSKSSNLPQDDADIINVPQHAVESLARCFLPGIRAFFESEEGKREYEEWQRQREEQAKTG